MHPLQVLAMLHNQYRRVARVDDPAVRTREDAREVLGGRGRGAAYQAKKALALARALGPDGIREAYAALFRADLDLKGARAIPGDVVLEVLVARLAALTARSRGGARGRPPGR
jgi:DNA polymerase III delta subunit